MRHVSGTRAALADLWAFYRYVLFTRGEELPECWRHKALAALRELQRVTTLRQVRHEHPDRAAAPNARTIRSVQP